MSNLTACVACSPKEITNKGSCQACPEGQFPNANQTVCKTLMCIPNRGGVQEKRAGGKILNIRTGGFFWVSHGAGGLGLILSKI